jgi:hypothetical protein
MPTITPASSDSPMILRGAQAWWTVWALVAPVVVRAGSRCGFMDSKTPVAVLHTPQPAIRFRHEKATQVLVDLPRLANDGQRRRSTLQNLCTLRCLPRLRRTPGYGVSSFGLTS